MLEVAIAVNDRYPGAHSETAVAQTRLIEVGESAPGFSLPSASGETVNLSDFRGREVVLFFYPMDNSPVCTLEACSFRDSYEAFREAGAEVIGISSDSSESHQRFADRFRLPFLLLSDRNGDARKRYGISKSFGLIPGRVTFLIDREGVVRHVFSSQFEPGRHVSEALTILKTLRNEPGTNKT
jgi:thioredoxin-dependent peroxiredoxin